MNDDEYQPAMQQWGRKLVTVAVLYGIVAVVLLLSACSDATGPSPLAPQFQKVNSIRDGSGGGGGGGGYGHAADCTRPNASVECALKAIGLTVGGGMLAGCSLASLGACLAGGAPAWAYGAYDYNNTPDCRTCGTEREGVGTGRSIGPTDPWNRPPGSPPDGGY